MEREHLIIIAIVLIVLWMLMGHSSSCNCSKCRTNMPARIRMEGTTMPEYIRMRTEEGNLVPERIRMSDKYFGATQHIQHHLRHDNRSKLMNGIFSGTPQHIRYGGCGPDGNDPCTL